MPFAIRRRVMPHRSAFGSDNELGVAQVSSGRRAESPDRWSSWCTATHDDPATAPHRGGEQSGDAVATADRPGVGVSSRSSPGSSVRQGDHRQKDYAGSRRRSSPAWSG